MWICLTPYTQPPRYRHPSRDGVPVVTAEPASARHCHPSPPSASGVTLGVARSVGRDGRVVSRSRDSVTQALSLPGTSSVLCLLPRPGPLAPPAPPPPVTRPFAECPTAGPSLGCAVPERHGLRTERRCRRPCPRGSWLLPHAAMPLRGLPVSWACRGLRSQAAVGCGQGHWSPPSAPLGLRVWGPAGFRQAGQFRRQSCGCMSVTWRRLEDTPKAGRNCHCPHRAWRAPALAPEVPLRSLLCCGSEWHGRSGLRLRLFRGAPPTRACGRRAKLSTGARWKGRGAQGRCSPSRWGRSPAALWGLREPPVQRLRGFPRPAAPEVPLPHGAGPAAQEDAGRYTGCAGGGRPELGSPRPPLLSWVLLLPSPVPRPESPVPSPPSSVPRPESPPAPAGGVAPAPRPSGRSCAVVPGAVPGWPCHLVGTLGPVSLLLDDGRVRTSLLLPVAPEWGPGASSCGRLS